ncbi:MAG: NTP transferase domain-containing protein [Pirellulales bacterium]|nr:NTP transferase domain-containing protein [Pirellulales bacterium]
MLKTLGIVDACYLSAQSRAKAARRMGGKSLLEWVVRRVTDCQRLDGVIVVTTANEENRFVSALVPLDVPLFVAHQADPLGSVAAGLAEYSAEAVVRVCTDYPFVDPTLIDRLVIHAQAHPECDYVGYCCRNGRPAILSPLGMYCEWLRSEAVRIAARTATLPPDREHVTRYLVSHPEKFTIRLIPVPAQIDRDDVRLTVDIEEDWENTLAIFEALGPEELDWQRIADLLDHQPALRKRMAALNRADAKS